MLVRESLDPCVFVCMPFSIVVPVNVMLIALPDGQYSDYRGMTKARGKPVLDSGKYRHGFGVTERKTIPPGQYTLVVSTYTPSQLGVFTLVVASSRKLSIDAVP